MEKNIMQGNEITEDEALNFMRSWNHLVLVHVPDMRFVGSSEDGKEKEYSKDFYFAVGDGTETIIISKEIFDRAKDLENLKQVDEVMYEDLCNEKGY